MAAAVTLLMTSVGRRVELIRHFRAYERSDPGRLRLLGTEIDPWAPAAQELGAALRVVPPVGHPHHARALTKLCADESVTAVFPLIDPDVEALSRLAVPLAAVGPSAADVVSDKWNTYNWLVQNHVPTVETWLPHDEALPSRYPVFLKPRRGSGGKDAYRVNNPEEYLFFSQYITEPVAQALLPGPEITADAVIGRDGDILAVALRERLAVRGGEVSRGRLVVNPTVEDRVARVVSALAPSGPITVQGMFDESDNFLVTEINGRMGGGLPLAIAGGLPLAEALVASWRGEPTRTWKPSDLTPGLHMARYDESLFWRSP